MARIPRPRGVRPPTPPPSAVISPSPIRRDRERWSDPYRPYADPPAGAVCRNCGAVYLEGRWVLDDAVRQEEVAVHGETPTLCAGCQRQAGHDPGGILTLAGEFWKEHWREIHGLLRNEEARIRAENPTSMILAMGECGGILEVRTTNPFLAKRLGQALRRAYGGGVRYVFSRGNPLARVSWVRPG